MGEIVVEAKLESSIDRGVFERGYGKESESRVPNRRTIHCSS